MKIKSKVKKTNNGTTYELNLTELSAGKVMAIMNALNDYNSKISKEIHDLLAKEDAVKDAMDWL